MSVNYFYNINNENFGLHDSSRAILKMSATENGKKPNLRIPITQHLIMTDLVFIFKYMFWGKEGWNIWLPIMPTKFRWETVHITSVILKQPVLP